MKGNRRYRSDFLFTRPSFIVGAGSVLNIAGRYYPFNYSESAWEADLKAIESDWGIAGEDIQRAYLAINEDQKLVAHND